MRSPCQRDSNAGFGSSARLARITTPSRLGPGGCPCAGALRGVGLTGPFLWKLYYRHIMMCMFWNNDDMALNHYFVNEV